ncbi:MAG: transaldolase family protein [Nanoarchaeota archaeon]
MRIFIDSADIEEIKKVKEYGLLDGVTTNPSLIKNAVRKLKEKGRKLDVESYIKYIFRVVGKKVPVSLEVVGQDYDEMIREGFMLWKKFKSCGNVYVKIPIDPCIEGKCNRKMDGIRAIKELSRRKVRVNCTLIFTPEQALLAAMAGANFVSPFVAREEDYIKKIKRKDNGIKSGIDLVAQIREIFNKQKVKNCEILAASVRDVRHFREVTLAGADIATMPLSVIEQLVKHYKTREGMKRFTEDIVPEYAKLVGYKKQ